MTIETFSYLLLPQDDVQQSIFLIIEGHFLDVPIDLSLSAHRRKNIDKRSSFFPFMELFRIIMFEKEFDFNQYL